MILTTADVVDSVVKEMRNSSGGAAQKSKNNGKNRSLKRNGSLISNIDDEEEGSTPDLEIVGPEGTRTFLHSLRHFMRRDRFKVHAHEGKYDSSTQHGNKNKNESVAQKKKKAKRKKSKGGDDKNYEQEIGFNVKSIPISYEPNNVIQHPEQCDESYNLPPSITKQAVSYLFTTPPIPGKFLIDKAQALNVPRGPMYAQLKAGKSVTFTDPNTNEERTVTSEEVVAKSSPGIGVAVIYCPTLKALNELKDTATFRELSENSSKEKMKHGNDNELELEAIVHLSPKSIFNEPAYQSWCKGFGTSVDHITLHSSESLEARAAEEENSPFVSGMCGGIRRSFVNDTLFPMPLVTSPNTSNGGDLKTKGEEGSSSKADDDDELQIIKACPMMDYVLMPLSRRGLNESTMKSLYSPNVINDLREQVKESGAIERAFTILSSSVTAEKEDGNNNISNEIDNSGNNNSSLGELIFTGTGSAIPCKHRNVTGMYLQMDNGNSMLLDVGEGTVGQLLRSWKSTLLSSSSSSSSSSNQQSAATTATTATAAIDEYRSRIRNIKAVWISHPHADHHLGLLRLLSERAAITDAQSDPIVLMAPHDMFDFLAEYQMVVPEIKQSYIPVDCWDMIHGRVNPLGNKLYDDLGITYCASIQVAHCLRSFAVVIDGTSFGRVAYSGDCRPSNQFADVAHGADLLIHEATFEIGMEEDAVLKRHSTVGEAIDIATKMNAKSLVLTHFSQRYPKIPPLKRIDDKGDAETELPIAFAFDFMILTPNAISLAAKLTPALRLLYSREGDEEIDSMVEEKLTAKALMAVPGVFATKGVL